jgi:hypothetical protein
VAYYNRVSVNIRDWIRNIKLKLDLERARELKGPIRREEGITRIFFATDLHGSNVCWKKFINAVEFFDANVLVLGGDTTGKAVVPIVEQINGTYRCTSLGEKGTVLTSESEVKQMMDSISNLGYYPYILTEKELKDIESAHDSHEITDRIFKNLMKERINQWVKLAEERLLDAGVSCYVCPGNDDPFEIDEIWSKSKAITHAEGKVIQIDHNHTMISSGWSNPTPWNTYREADEARLEEIFEKMISKVDDMSSCIFNLHAPPYNSGLDEAPELDKDLRPKYGGQSMVPVGSAAVRTVIERHQPLLSLHGHIHESRGERKIGKTTAVNPGSSYSEGWLQGAIIDLDPDRLKLIRLLTG